MAPCLQLDLRLRCTRPFLAGSWVWNLILRYVGVNITAVTTPIVFGHVTDPATVSIGDCAIIDRNALVHGHLMQLSGLQFSPTSIRPCNHVVTSSAATSWAPVCWRAAVVSGGCQVELKDCGEHGMVAGVPAFPTRVARLIKAAPWRASGSTPARLLVQ